MFYGPNFFPVTNWVFRWSEGNFRLIKGLSGDTTSAGFLSIIGIHKSNCCHFTPNTIEIYQLMKSWFCGFKGFRCKNLKYLPVIRVLVFVWRIMEYCWRNIDICFAIILRFFNEHLRFAILLFFQAIYDMLGACSSNRPADSAEERAKNIFAKMDENNDGQLTQDEFLKGCLQDEELSKMLAP